MLLAGSRNAIRDRLTSISTEAMARTDPLLTSSQALYVIERLIAEGRVSAAAVEKIAAEMASEIQRLETRLALLRGQADSDAAGDSRKISAETRESRRLQGLYMSLIRQVPSNQRARFKQIAKAKGREEAVKALRKVVDPKDQA
jgi:hypothetical protein